MKKFILLGAAAISLMACTTEDYNIDDPIEVQVSANIGESDLSRASDVTWDAGDKIGISMSGRYSNMLYTSEMGDGEFTGTPMYFKNKVDPVTLTAYYPYVGTEGEAAGEIEASTSSERQNPSQQPLFDFLYDKKENVTGATPNVKFAFKHKMSKLTLTFKKVNASTDVRKITSCEINGLILDGTFNTATGECFAKAGTPSDALSLSPTVTEDNVSLSLILFPQTVEKVTLKITDNENQEYSCELKFTDNRLESGDNYCYTIKVSKTELKIEDYAIVGWIEKTNETPAMSD